MRLLAAAILASGLCTAAHADTVTVTQVNSNINILPGQAIDLQFLFTAPTTNTGTVSDTSLTIQYYSNLFTSAFNSPLYAFSLAPGQSATQYIDYLRAFNTDPAGLYTGNLLVYSGTTLLGTGTYSVNVLPTPEPSSIALLGTGLLGLVGVARKRFATA